MASVRPGGFQVLPPVVKNLIIINVLMAAIQMVLGSRNIDLADYLGLHYWRSWYFRPWQYVTHMFMHGSAFSLNATVMHLFTNMFALWMFGSVLENLWGAKRFLTFYFLCGLGAAACHLAVLGYNFHVIEGNVLQFYQNPTADQFNRLLQQNDWGQFGPFANLNAMWQSDPGGSYRTDAVSLVNQSLYGFTDGASGKHYDGYFDQVTVGASGAVFGILLAFGYLFPNLRLYFYFLVPVKAKWFVLFYAAFELYSGLRANPGDNVAHFAHLGGMLFGFILLRLWRMKPDRYA